MYLGLLGLNLFAVLLAAASALLIPAPQEWPGWMPWAWWTLPALLTLVVLSYRRHLLSRSDAGERRVAALSLAALPLVWGLFAVLAFWTGQAPSGVGLTMAALAFALLGFALQPGE